MSMMEKKINKLIFKESQTPILVAESQIYNKKQRGDLVMEHDSRVRFISYTLSDSDCEFSSSSKNKYLLQKNN